MFKAHKKKQLVRSFFTVSGSELVALIRRSHFSTDNIMIFMWGINAT